MLVVIVASGATVRLTGSGLGCEHWPGCQAGDPFPKTGYHSDIEFSNRVVAAVAILATLAALARRASGARRADAGCAGSPGGAFVGTLLQAPLGAITVHYKLNPWLVGTHFLLSIVVLALGVLVALEAWGDPRRARPLRVRIARARRRDRLRRAARLAASLATAAGPHSGAIEVPRVWKFEPAVWLHVRATAVFGIDVPRARGLARIARARPSPGRAHPARRCSSCR